MAPKRRSSGEAEAAQPRASNRKAKDAPVEDAPSLDPPGAPVAAPVAGGAPREGQGYVVLARRFRPGQFEEVVGQEHVTRTLQNAITAGRVHHAYLFTGSRGVGKTTVARLLAKALDCDAGATAHPCDRCTSCQEIRTGTSVDVFEIDGASHTGVDDVRGLREGVRYQPARCRYKIYIIDEVHMLSTSAFNALLKTLEEPPPHVVFIFATTEPHKIPATILSRCQRFDFKRVPDPLLIKHLQHLCEREGIAVETAGLALIARASEGSVRDALSLLDQVIAFAVGETAIAAGRVAEVLGVADRRVLFELSRVLLARDARAALELIARLYESGQDLFQLAQAFLAHLRDLTVVRSCADADPLVEVTAAEMAELRAQAAGAGGELLAQHFERFARTTEEMARSAFPRLLLEMAAIEMAHAEPLLPLGDLLERLERLEARLGGASPLGAPPRPVPASPGRGAGGDRSAGVRSASDAPLGRLTERGGPAVAQVKAADRAKTADRAKAADRAGPADRLPAAGEATVSPRQAVEGATPVDRVEGELSGWLELLRRVEAVQPMAASAFVSGKLLSFSGDTILLGYPPGSFELTRAQSRDKQRLFEEACGELVGRQLALRVRELRPDEASSPEVVRHSALEDRERQQEEHTRRLREEAEEHPVTRTLVDRFGAVIDSINTEAEDP